MGHRGIFRSKNYKWMELILNLYTFLINLKKYG